MPHPAEHRDPPAPERSRRRRRGTGAAGVLAVLLTLAGCTSHTTTPHDDSQAQLEQAAATLATSLEHADLDGVTLDGTATAAATEQRRDVFVQLPAPPTVSVTKVERGTGTASPAPDAPADPQDAATATLQWSWPLGTTGTWTYTTTAQLVRQAPAATQPSGSATGDVTPAAAAPTATTAGPVWQVVWDPSVLLPDLTAGEHVAVQRLRPARGEILDRSGHAIVKDRPVHHLGIDKTHATPAQQQSSAKKLAKAVGLDPTAYAHQVAAAGPKAFVEAIVLRADDPTDIAALTALPGVSAVDGSLALAPTRTWARPLLGTVGAATQEIVDASGGRVRPGDQTGLSGIQQQYDAQLAGTAGVVVTLTGGSGDDTELYRVDAHDGTPLRLSLDTSLQTAAEQILADQTSSASALVAVDSSGHVLVAASGPGGGGLSTATLGKYAPGSTMKVATSLALLHDGDTATSTLRCTPSLTVDGRRFTNDDGYPSGALGTVPLRTAFANSCNTAFLSTAGRVSAKDLHAAAADLGLGVPSPLGVPAFFGSVPTDSTGTDHAASLIGQGRVEASPLAMATVAASVAAGHRVSPVLVTGVEAPPAPAGTTPTAGTTPPSAPPSGTPTTTPSPAATPAPSRLTAADARTLHTLMRAVVTEGTGTILRPLGHDIGAKTGTAQYGDGSTQHAWMIATDGTVGVAAFVEDGGYGATTAGPLLKEFLQKLEASGLAG